MPQDTIWLNHKGDCIAYDSSIHSDSLIKIIETSSGKDISGSYSYNIKNSPHADSILRILIADQAINKEKIFSEEKEKYDHIGDIFEFIVLIIFILFGISSYRRAKKYKENPFAEDERDWIEIGLSSRNNFGDHPDNNYQLYRKPTPQKIPDCLVYNGYDLKFSDEQIVTVLEKRFPYFKQLGFSERTRFLNRLKKFMKSKIFKIHDRSGFKEMPILLSATAIQISFGLDEYLLPYYEYFHIFPQEFLGVEPSIRFLEGNVSGKAINISWKHFLKGYELENDGQNVGLHEMAHAYYCQNFTFGGNKDDGFIQRFPTYTNNSNKVFEVEKADGKGLYSEYALKNFQEFWAESVEIFFEKPSDMKVLYPDLYTSLSLLLNQKPV